MSGGRGGDGEGHSRLPPARDTVGRWSPEALRFSASGFETCVPLYDINARTRLSASPGAACTRPWRAAVGPAPVVEPAAALSPRSTEMLPQGLGGVIGVRDAEERASLSGVAAPRLVAILLQTHPMLAPLAAAVRDASSRGRDRLLEGRLGGVAGGRFKTRHKPRPAHSRTCFLRALETPARRAGPPLPTRGGTRGRRPRTAGHRTRAGTIRRPSRLRPRENAAMIDVRERRGDRTRTEQPPGSSRAPAPASAFPNGHPPRRQPSASSLASTESRSDVPHRRRIAGRVLRACTPAPRAFPFFVSRDRWKAR